MALFLYLLDTEWSYHGITGLLINDVGPYECGDEVNLGGHSET